MEVSYCSMYGNYAQKLCMQWLGLVVVSFVTSMKPRASYPQCDRKWVLSKGSDSALRLVRKL